MEKRQHHYEIIKGIVSQAGTLPASPEKIKAEIANAIQGCDYISAVIDYLWEAYYHFDRSAKTAFDAIFSADLKAQKPDVFYFFSLYFGDHSLRRGFDRRLDSDRRSGYSLELHLTVTERRAGRERRGKREKRLDWTRITEWTSVPFKPADDQHGKGMPGPDGDGAERFPFSPGSETGSAVNLHSLNAILADLVVYYECYMQPGQTAWLDVLDRETFLHAKQVMRRIVEISTTGWTASAAEERLPGALLSDPTEWNRLRKKQ